MSAQPTKPETLRTLATHFFLAQDARKGPLDSAICHPDYRVCIGSNPEMDIAGHSQFGAAFYAGFPDLTHTINDTLVENNKVVVRFTLRGTH